MLALTILMKGLAKEMVLVGENNHQAQGEAYDLIHASSFAHPMKIYAGPIEATSHSDIIVVSASVPMTNMKNRLDLGTGNATLFRNLIPQLSQLSPEAIFIIITNPVDIMTYYTIRLSNFPPSRVIGTGTLIDSGRFRSLLGLYSGIHPEDIHAYILGEHGDTELPVWSLADIGGMPIPEFFKTSGKPYDTKQAEELFQGVRDAAYTIIEKKGSTYYAIAMGLERIVECILRDENSVLSVSTLLSDFHGVSDICLGVPAVINRTGVSRVIELPLNPEEQAAFRHSAKVLQEVARSIGL